MFPGALKARPLPPVKRRRIAPERCLHCAALPEHCQCESIQPQPLNTRVVLVMHHHEAQRRIATAPFALSVIQGAALHLYGIRDQPLNLEFLHMEGRRVLVLSPSREATELSPALIGEDPRPVTLVVPEGNARQAGRAGRRVPGLNRAEQVTLPPSLHGSLIQGSGAFSALGLCTFDALLLALEYLEPPTVVAELRRAWEIARKARPVEPERAPDIEQESQTAPSQAPSEPLTILYWDEHLVAVEKPSGVSVHRGWSDDRCPVLKLLRDQLGRRVYPIHRLDRATSGALLFAQSPEVARDVQILFELERVQKRYLAVCRGHGFQEKVVDHPLSHEGSAKKAARTRFRLLGSFERYGLVEAIPETGRTHQIRKHLKHIAHPIIGDVRYGKGEHNRVFRERFGFCRLALHCQRLSLPHPRRAEQLVIEAPPSHDFEQLLLALGLIDIAKSTPPAKPEP